MVVGPDGFDLRTRDRVPPGTQSLANGARVVLWMMKEIDENVDDTSEIQFLGSRWWGEFLSFRPLPGSWLRLGAEVNVGVLEWFSLQLTRPHQETQGVVHAQMQEVLEFGVGLACR